LDKEIGDIKSEIKKCLADNRQTVASFKKFIELKENLHWYWHNANEEQKKRLAEILILNQTVKGTEIRSINWNGPFAQAPKTPEFQDGGAYCHAIELYFTTMWECSFNSDNRPFLTDVNTMFNDRNPPLKIVE